MDDYGKVLEYVLKGDAVLLVGSGASAEMGYPSWSDQIEFLEKKVAEQGKELPNEFYEYKNKCQLPQAMESIERLIGRSGLLNLLRVSLVPARPSEDSIYNVVTKWPFQLYLTTNFDDEIIKHLKKNKRTEFAVLGNSESDFSVLLPDATGYVFKIHGELTENGGAVVTDKDYDGFKVGADKRYYRKALQALFRSRRIIVIGYSFSDSDLRYLLDRATEDASLAYPLCVFLPDATQQQIEKFSRSMSVAVVPYSNSDKKHTALKRILSLLNSFIRPDSPTTIHTEDSRRAASLYLFRKLSRGRSCRNIRRH